jgi:hypothetical protein
MPARRFARTGPRPGTGRPGPRPEQWITGPDPAEHIRYRTWVQQRNQAQWRDEGWTITFDEWKQIWADSGQWDNRGRERGCWCMSRQDWGLPWTTDNVAIITREEHARLQGDARAAGWSSIAQKRRRGRDRQGQLDLGETL